MKKIEDYLHLYLGCRCMTPEGETNLSGVSDNCEPTLSTVFGSYPHEQVFPILRSLSSMTEDERTEIESLSALPGIDKYFPNGAPKSTWWICADRVRYLLSKHFDLFGLIESGLAIDATTIEHT